MISLEKVRKMITKKKPVKTRKVGAFGEITFECSSKTVRTFTNYKRENKARYATHNLIMQKPALEFLGPDLMEISFKMILTVNLGTNPMMEADKLRKMCEEGTAAPLIMGSQVIGEHQWVIESVTESAQAWDNSGNILLNELDVRLKEYVEEKGDGVQASS